MAPLNDRETYLEWLQVGDLIRLNAIDAGSGVEVVVSGPASAARFDLERLALRKLQRALIEAGVIGPPETGSGEPHAPPSGRRGKLV